MPVTRPLAAVTALATLILSACAVTRPRAPTAPVPAAAPPPAITTSRLPSPTLPASACEAAQLQLTRAGNDAGMGHRAFAFRYTNSSTQACMLGGYPRVRALDMNGDPVSNILTSHATRSYLVPTTHHQAAQILQPGQSLWFVVTWSVIPRGNTPCPGMATLRIAPPIAIGGGNLVPASTASSSAAEAALAIPAGKLFDQVSTVCNGIQVMPLRSAPAQH